MLRLAIVGHGAIARYVARALKNDPSVRIAYVLCRDGREPAARDAIGGAVEAVTSVSQITGDVDVAVECAGHGGLIAHGPGFLEQGVDVITVSVGALADPAVADILTDAAKRGNARLELVPGALGGIDALAGARWGGLDSVTYEGRKPPLSWVGTPAEDQTDLASLTEAFEHFNGSARDAATRYPKNANVAAAVAIAGLGLDDTMVRLIADPSVKGNQHVVIAEGTFGRFRFEIEGKALPENPRTSALAAMSLLRAIGNRGSGIAT